MEHAASRGFEGFQHATFKWSGLGRASLGTAEKMPKIQKTHRKMWLEPPHPSPLIRLWRARAAGPCTVSSLGL